MLFTFGFGTHNSAPPRLGFKAICGVFITFQSKQLILQQLTLNWTVICCRVYNPPCPPYQGGIGGGNCRSLPPLSEGGIVGLCLPYRRGVIVGLCLPYRRGLPYRNCRSVFRSDKEEMSRCLPLDSVLIIVLRRDWDSKQSAVFLSRFTHRVSKQLILQQPALNWTVIQRKPFRCPQPDPLRQPQIACEQIRRIPRASLFQHIPEPLIQRR